MTAIEPSQIRRASNRSVRVTRTGMPSRLPNEKTPPSQPASVLLIPHSAMKPGTFAE